jgi:hypothetical protein
MPALPHPHVHMGRASLGEVDKVLEILDEAARWLASRGIDQWPVPMPRGRVIEGFEQGDCYLAWEGPQAVAR